MNLRKNVLALMSMLLLVVPVAHAGSGAQQVKKSSIVEKILNPYSVALAVVATVAAIREAKEFFKNFGAGSRYYPEDKYIDSLPETERNAYYAEEQRFETLPADDQKKLMHQKNWILQRRVGNLEKWNALQQAQINAMATELSLEPSVELSTHLKQVGFDGTKLNSSVFIKKTDHKSSTALPLYNHIDTTDSMLYELSGLNQDSQSNL